MKKFQILYTLAILLSYSFNAMSMQRLLLRTPNSPKSLGNLSFYEVNKLAQNKELARKEFKSALSRHEDTKATSVFDRQSPDIESLWKDFKTLFDMKSELDSDFSFNQVATQIRELRVAALTLKSFYQRKTNPRKRTLEAIQEWIDRNKIKTSIAIIMIYSIDFTRSTKV